MYNEWYAWLLEKSSMMKNKSIRWHHALVIIWAHMLFFKVCTQDVPSSLFQISWIDPYWSLPPTLYQKNNAFTSIWWNSQSMVSPIATIHVMAMNLTMGRQRFHCSLFWKLENMFLLITLPCAQFVIIVACLDIFRWRWIVPFASTQHHINIIAFGFLLLSCGHLVHQTCYHIFHN